MMFPTERPRRLRRTPAIRELVRETSLAPSDFIYPLFVRDGRGERRPVASMPGVFQFSPDTVLEEVDRAVARGIKSVLLFGIPAYKDARGSAALDPEGPVPAAVRRIKDRHPELVVMCDLCLCDYTDHGHCGLVTPAGEIDNDSSIDQLAQAAVVFAEAGADVIAPSDMMDGRVGAIRRRLDQNGRVGTLVMSYAAKYASSFYGPFREAAESAPAFGDRRSYQMDPGNAREALREVRLDVEEGADIVMVKPALPYLDVLRRVRDAVDLPVAAYQVSGEYSMIKAAAQRGWLSEPAVVLETLYAIRRAGADLILTYFAVDAAAWLDQA
ncbi:MAG: porphobilinogen synthase [Actinomycetia bacterium]|nr:porphobilinogen synthase [Actinomycetes bacterium]